MQKIKPAEVSALLKKQLESADIQSSFDEIGTVLEVGDGIARVYGLSNAQYGELVSFDNGLQGMVLNLEEDHVGIVLFGTSKGVKEGDSVSCGDLIAEVETDKVIMEIETSYNGIIGKILVNEGQDSIKINEPIAILLLEDKTWHRDFLILHRNGLYVVKEKSFKSLDNAKTYIDTFLNESWTIAFET